MNAKIEKPLNTFQRLDEMGKIDERMRRNDLYLNSFIEERKSPSYRRSPGFKANVEENIVRYTKYNARFRSIMLKKATALARDLQMSAELPANLLYQVNNETKGYLTPSVLPDNVVMGLHLPA